MHYENPRLPEGGNYPDEHPLRELVVLLAGALALIVAGVFALSLAAGWLARQVPFASEQSWAEPFAEQLAPQETDPGTAVVRARLQVMLDRIARLQQFPPEMTLRVHVIDGNEVNAFATLGGHIVVTRGLLAALPHEQALVTVLAHEAAHVQHRDPLVALGRGVAVMTALGALSGFGDGGAAMGGLQRAGLLTTLSFNRDMERAADADALTALQRWYGYTAGAADLFAVLAKAHAGREIPAFLSTHPSSSERMAGMRAAETPGPLRPVPAEIADWLKRSGE